MISKRFKFILILWLCSSAVIAQPGGGGDPGGGDPVPLTGIEILIGAGALLGAKRLSDLRNKKK